jgi:hypothetical protein
MRSLGGGLRSRLGVRKHTRTPALYLAAPPLLRLLRRNFRRCAPQTEGGAEGKLPAYFTIPRW